MTKKVEEIIKRIERDCRKLEKETGVSHISSYLIDGSFSIEDYSHLRNPIFKYYSRGDENE